MAAHQVVGISLSLVSAWLLHFLYRLYKNRKWFNGLPQPPHSSIWGHLKVMGEISRAMPPNMHPQAYLTAIAQKYNLEGIFYLDLWPIADSMCVITDPALMNQVTVVKSLPIHTMAEEFISPIVGRNVVATTNGPLWKKTHNAMAPAFSWSHIRNLTSIVTDECLLFRETLDKLAQTGEVFSMEDTSAKLIFDVIGRIVFNLPLHAQTKGSSYLTDLRDMIRLADAQLSWNPFVKLRAFFKRKTIFDRLQVSIVRKIYERLDLLRSEKIVPSKKDPFSILDLMLREHVEQDNDAKGKKSEEIPPDELELLVTNIKGLLVGGHGTTTDALCYIYMLLSKSPEVVQKLREEHTRVFDPDFNETLNILHTSPQKLDELEYTTAVIKETLRLFPVGFGVREAAEDGATITHNNKIYPISNHLAVIPTSHTLHYDATFFPNPSKFLPERFLDDHNPVPRSNFRTFGRGPRACLGQNLAQDELRIILLLTMREYEFECAGLKPNATPKTSYTELDTVYGDIVFQELGLEARPRGGMMMKCRKV